MKIRWVMKECKTQKLSLYFLIMFSVTFVIINLTLKAWDSPYSNASVLFRIFS